MIAGSARRQWKAVKGDVAAIIEVRAFRAAMLHALRRDVESRPILSNWQALFDYLHVEMAHQPIERIRALYLNTRNRLIKDELVATGSIDECAIHVREIILRALELGAAAIILAHNHPSGDHAPSRADIDITRAIAEAGRRMGIAVHDHLIMSSTGHASLRSMGLI